MIDRQLVGDILMAALLAVPTAALARPEGVPQFNTHELAGPTQSTAAALTPAADRQVGFFR